MALILSDRIKETTTTTGTSNPYVLGGAASGFETFTANLSNGDTTYYCCTDGTDFEVGLGTYASTGTKLTRTTIISSSNSNNAVNWSSGTRDIFCTLPGSKAVVLDANGALSTGISIQDEGSGLSTTATTLNFVGSGIVASGTGATKTITVTGGGIGTSAANYFDAHTSSDSSALTSSFATIDFDTIRYNSNGSIFSESAGEVTMTTTGIHRFHADVTTKITSGGSRSDCEIELQRKPSGGSFSQVAGSTAITYNRTSGRGEQTSSIDILYNVTSGDAYRVVVKRQGGTDTIVVQGGAARFNISSVGANPTVATTAADDLTAGDAAVNLTTTSGNITIDAQGSDTDIIFKGTDGSSDITALTLDMSDAGAATFNSKITAVGTSVFTNLDISGDVDIDGTLETDALSIASTTVTATATELNYVDVTTLGTVQASKAVTADANGDVLFSDGDKIKFGTDSDASITHDGSNLIIDSDLGTTFYQGGQHHFKNQFGTETHALFQSNGGTQLYFDNVKKFETTSDGATVTGALTTTEGITVTGGDSGDVLLTFATDRTWQFQQSGDNASTRLQLKANTDSKSFDIISNDSSVNFSFFTSNSGTPQFTLGQNAIILFEGATDDDFETTLSATDPTADRIITLPDATGTVFTSGNPNDITDIGIQAFDVVLGTGSDLVFEGATSNSNETTLTVVDPTADRTVTLPDATGTVLTTGNSDTPTTTTSSSDADFVLVDDGGTMKKITPSNLGITSGGASKGFAVAMAIAL